MDKVQLIAANREDKIYYVNQITGEFYTTHIKLSARVIAFVLTIALYVGIAVFHGAIDAFYMPRSSTMNNALLLAALVVAATIFHFWTKARDRKKLVAQKPQPVPLEDERKKKLLKKTVFRSRFTLVLVAALLLAACIFGYFFIRTAESMFFALTSLSLLSFAALAHWVKYIFHRIRIVHKLLKPE